jgi:hypothetical protein
VRLGQAGLALLDAADEWVPSGALGRRIVDGHELLRIRARGAREHHRPSHTLEGQGCGGASLGVSGDDVADPLGWALFGIEGGGPPGEPVELAAELLELGDASFELGGAALQ